MQQPALSVVVLTYNSSADIVDCLNEIGIDDPQFEVIVIDNNSSDDSVSRVRSNFQNVKLIENTENVGFAKAVNAAVGESSGSLIALINPDCRISRESLIALMKLFQVDQVGVAAPAISHPTGRLSVRSAGYSPTLRGMTVHATGLGRIPKASKWTRGFHLYPSAERTTLTEVDWVSGACLVTRRTIWNKLHGLSERWFMYAEDIHFCHQVQLLGYTIVHNSSVNATHVIGASSEQSSGPVWTLWIENLLDYYNTTFLPSKLRFSCWKFVTIAMFFSRALVYKLRSFPGPANRRSAWARESEKFIAYAKAVVRTRQSTASKPSAFEVVEK